MFAYFKNVGDFSIGVVYAGEEIIPASQSLRETFIITFLYAVNERSSAFLDRRSVNNFSARPVDPRREIIKAAKLCGSPVAARAYRVSLRNESTWET